MLSIGLSSLLSIVPFPTAFVHSLYQYEAVSKYIVIKNGVTSIISFKDAVNLIYAKKSRRFHVIGCMAVIRRHCREDSS